MFSKLKEIKGTINDLCFRCFGLTSIIGTYWHDGRCRWVKVERDAPNPHFFFNVSAFLFAIHVHKSHKIRWIQNNIKGICQHILVNYLYIEKWQTNTVYFLYRENITEMTLDTILKEDTIIQRYWSLHMLFRFVT